MRALFCLAALLAAPRFCENPASHLMTDPASPRLSPSGYLITAGPAFSLTLRQGTEYGEDYVPWERRGLTTRIYGAGTEVLFDNADRKGRWHLLPSAALYVFPFQKSYVDDVDGVAYECQFYHCSAGVGVGYADSLGKRGTRRYAAVGPVFNLLVYQGNSVWSRPAWGATLRAGAVFPRKQGRPLILEAAYRYVYYKRYYWGYGLDMDEHSHGFTLSAGTGL